MEKIICGLSYKFIKIMENRMYGIEKIKVKDEEVNISSKERTLIDLIYFNKPVGGIISASKIFIKIVNNDKCDMKKNLSIYCRNYQKKNRSIIPKKSIKMVFPWNF
jgi:predicted transcriptional regulator of viral defense system